LKSLTYLLDIKIHSNNDEKNPRLIPKTKLENKLHKEATIENHEEKEYRKRNSQLIKDAKILFRAEHDGNLYCEICKINFEKLDGVYGEGIIQGHHKILFSTLENNTVLTPKDIMIVCPNCHIIIHRNLSICSFKEIKLMIT